MDASNKQPTLAEKFAAVWEKKNARAARAGGVSLMALSLAACGSDDDTVATTTAATTTATDTSTTTPVASSFDLTNGTDTLSGAGTFNAGMVWSPGGTDRIESLQSEDTVTGTGTADIINITNNGGAIAPKLIGVETVNFNVAGATAGTLNLSNSSGITTVALSSTDGDVGVSGVGTGVEVKVAGIADASTNAFANMTATAVLGSATAATVSVDGFVGTNINVGSSAAAGVSGAGVETLTLNSSGEVSSIASLGSSGATTINVNASQTTTVSAFTATGITTLDASGSTGSTTLNVAANVNANDFAYTGGSGTDTLIANSGFTGTDNLNGGDGADTFSIRVLSTSGDVTVGALSAASAAVVSNIETLDMRSLDNGGANAIDFTVDMDHMPGVTALSMRAGDTGTATVFNLNDMNATQAGAISLGFNGTGNTTGTDATVNLGLKDASGTADSATITITASIDDDATPASNQTALIQDSTTNNAIESLTVNLAGTKGIILSTEAATFGTSLTVTGGAADQSLTTGTTFNNTTVDMSAVASNITFTMGTLATQTVKTGSGADTINAAAGSKTIDLGANDDTLVTGTAGIGNAVANVDSFNGGDGADTLHVTGTFTDSGTVLGVVSNFETLRLDPAGTQAVTMSNFINNAGFTKIIVDDAGGGTITVNNASSSLNTLRLEDGVAGETVVFGRLVDTADNTLAIDSRTATATATALTINNEEIVNYSSNAAADDTTITTVTSADLTTLNISGAGDLLITNAIASSTKLKTVDASASTGGVEVHANNSAVAMTATGNSASAGVFEFTGGSAADTITGGGGADILLGGDGADTISGGGAADTIYGGLGVDTITGGAGSDNFEFRNELDGGTTGEVITDFVSTADNIIIQGALETAVDIAGGATALVTVAQATAGTAVAATFGTSELLFVSKEDNAAESNSVTASNLGNLTMIATLISEAFTEADNGGVAAKQAIFAVESSDIAGKFGLYTFQQQSATDVSIVAGSMTLLGIVTGDDVVAGDITF
jgi:Ca2+-binding RTX toxin-like protein